MDPRTEVLKLLTQHGRVVRTTKHTVWEVNARKVVVPISASDKRAWLNLRAAIRRALTG